MSRRRKRVQHSSVDVLELTKVNPAYAALTLQSDLPAARSMPRAYKAYALEGFRACDTVYKCISYLITNGAAIPPKLYTDYSKEKEIEKHPLLDKLRRPNPEQSGVAYRKAILGYYNVAGNSYQYAIRKGTSGPPDELWVLDPDKVSIIPSRSRGIIGYEFKDFPKEQNPIPAENIGHMKSWAPDDPLYGISPIEVGAIRIDQQAAANKWNLALLQNMAKPPGAWVLSQILSPNDRNQLKMRLKEELSGYRNAGVAPLLDGGLQWQSTGLPPIEMDWLNSQKFNGGAIANLFNMPPQLIGDTSSTTYNNMDQAKVASYTEGIFPQLDELYDLWNMWLVPMYPDLCDKSGKPTAYLYYDKETVEVIQALIQTQKQAQSDRANKLWMSGECTMNEARVLSGLPEVPEGNVYRLGAILVPADKLTDYAEQSLTTPAAPPMPVPEPVSVNGQQPSNAPQQGNGNDNSDNADSGNSNASNASTGNTNSHSNDKNLLLAPSRRTVKVQQDEEHVGVMVAFFLDAKSAKKLALPDGEQASDLHVTLACLGDKDDCDIKALKKDLAAFSSESLPLEGNVSGLARFAPSDSSDGKVPVIALVNVKGIQKWRETLVKLLEAAGCAVADDFEYTPHITLAYIDADDPMPVDDVPQIDLTFDRLWLAVGDDRYSFVVGDEQYPPRKARKWARPTNGWEPDDLDDQLDAHRRDGATYLTWHVDGDPCDKCLLNDGVEVELGDPFPSGALLAPQHPNCKCHVESFAEYVLKGKHHDNNHRKPERSHKEVDPSTVDEYMADLTPISTDELAANKEDSKRYRAPRDAYRAFTEVF